MAGRRLALIVATDEYVDPGLRKLRAPAQDADALAKVLADPELGDFEVDVLRNETSSAIGERVETVLGGGKTDDLIVLHFSCHGLKDDSGELYLAASNTRPTLLASTAVDASLVNRLMRRSRAQRVVLFLDCCYGGAFERGMVPRAAGVVDVADQFQQREQELGGGRGRVVITASNAMEFAFEGTDLADTIESQPSIFTGALVDGLASGEADRDQDGVVSLGELYDYVFERVRRQSPNQTPGKWEFGLQGELILAKNPQRVIVPAPVPADLLALIEHPFPATRLGSIEVLTKLVEGANLPFAAGARAAIERMVNDDSRSVASAATDAIAKTSVRLSEETVDLGTVEAGATATAEVSIEGVPLAIASRVEASGDAIRVRRVDRTIRIEADTSVPRQIDEMVTVSGAAGNAKIHVVGVVASATAEKREIAPKAERAKAAEPRPVPDAPVGVAGSTTVVPSQPSAATARAKAIEPPSRMPSRDANDNKVVRSSRFAWATARHAAARGALGSVLADVIATAIYFGWSLDRFFGDSRNVSFFVSTLIVDAVAVALLVGLVEAYVPAARVPDGAVYGPWRGHRIRAATLQGAVVGLSIGVLIYQWLISSTGGTFVNDIYILSPASTAIGFAIAEFVLQKTAREKTRSDSTD
jgi:Caspase domain